MPAFRALCGSTAINTVLYGVQVLDLSLTIVDFVQMVLWSGVTAKLCRQPEQQTSRIPSQPKADQLEKKSSC